MNIYQSVDIVIVLYKEKYNTLYKTLKSIKGFKIIIIDNDGNSELKKEICAKFDIYKYILNEKNLGFSAGYNQGIHLSTSEFLLILGPDCIITKSSIEILIRKYLHYKDALILCPVSFNDKKNLTYSSGYLPENGEKNKILTIDGDVCVESTLGACMLINRNDLIKEDLFFDENFFIYFSDDDLCRRIRIKQKSVIQTFDASCIHQHGIIKVKNKFKKVYIRSFVFNYDRLYYFFKINKHLDILNNYEKKKFKLFLRFLIKLLSLQIFDMLEVYFKLYAYYKFKFKYIKK